MFNIDIETCTECGGPVKVIACIEDPVVIRRILDHLKQKADANEPSPLPESRAPPRSLYGRADKTTDDKMLSREPRQGPGLPGGWEGG